MTTRNGLIETPSPYVPLQRPPSAIHLTVRKLIGKVQEGSVRVPPFQRPLRWTQEDVVKLFDSLLKGYPIGSLLFWKQAFESGDVRVGSAVLKVAATPEGWYIVDGQQRTTALASGLLELEQHGDKRWDVYYDLDAREVRKGPTSTSPKRVPLRVLGDLRRLGRWITEQGLNDEDSRHVEEVQQRLLDYDLPGYLMETSDEEALRGVFARLNSTGVRMRSEEVFQALFTDRGSVPHGKRTIDLETVAAATDQDGFGMLPRNETLKALLAMSGLDPSKRFDQLNEADLGKLVPADEAIDTLRRVVAFLQAGPTSASPGAGIPAFAFLPYPVVLTILARWFHLFPESDNSTRQALGRWLWRGVAAGVHQRAEVSKLRLQVRKIQPGDAEDSLRQLLDVVPEPSLGEWALESFHTMNARSRVEILALLALRPRSPHGGFSWRGLVSSGERVAREIFPVPGSKGPLRKQLQTAANRALLDHRKIGLSVAFKKWTWEANRDALESHLIDEHGYELLLRGETENFLAHRGSRVRTVVSRFVADMTQAGKPLVLDASAYFDARSVE